MGSGNSSSNNELAPIIGLEDRAVKQIAGVCWLFSTPPRQCHIPIACLCLLLPYDVNMIVPRLIVPCQPIITISCRANWQTNVNSMLCYQLQRGTHSRLL